MKPEIEELIKISRYYGCNKEYVIAGGGNTSYKDESTIWIKASGQSMAELTYATPSPRWTSLNPA